MSIPRLPFAPTLSAPTRLKKDRQARFRRAHSSTPCPSDPQKNDATTDTYEIATLPVVNNVKDQNKALEVPLTPQPPAPAVLVGAHAPQFKPNNIPAFIPEEEIAAAEASFAPPKDRSLEAMFANLQRLQERNGWAPPDVTPETSPQHPPSPPVRQGTRVVPPSLPPAPPASPEAPITWPQAQQLLALHQHNLGEHPINLGALVNVGASYNLTRQALDITIERLHAGGLRNPGAFALGVLRNIQKATG